ncbi:response regulator [Pseudomonas lalucatii]|nr:response regulator [Pseudomonas lalucatii]
MAESDAQTRLWQPAQGAERPLSVLVVDDDELIRMHLQLALSNEGLRISEAANGQQAVELASRQAFDIVLMDVRMPGMDGFAACERLKQLPGHASTPVVMLTGMEDQESIRRATQVGAIDYVTKPLSATVLAKRVRHIVQAQRNHAELDNQRASQNALLHAIPDTILRFDAEGILLASKFPEACPSLLRMRSAIGSSIREIFSGVPRFDPAQALQRALHGDTTALQIAWPGAEESIYEVRFVASAANDVMCILRDISRQVRQQRRIEQLSLSDGQTGLANRACFLQMAQRQLDAAPEQALCMLQLSFASYPSVSRSVGSKTADQLIRVLADTLVEASGASRQLDPSGAGDLPFIARTGEADFHLLLGDEREALDALLRRVCQAVEEPIQVDQYEFRLPLRAGIVSTEAANGNVDELFKMSGLAAQKASQRQLSEPLVYSPALQRESQRSLLLESALRRAIAQGELELLYQPKVCAHNGQLKSLEALCRWTHPELGAISPAEFIPWPRRAA